MTDLVTCFAEELEASTLSSSADNQAERPVTSSVKVSDPDLQPAEPPHLDVPGPVSESNNSPSANTVTPWVTAEDPACTPPPVDLLQFSGTCEPTEDSSPSQDREDAPAENRVEPGDDPHSSHEQAGDDPEE